MAAPLPWFPLYVDELETDERWRVMTWEQRGIYVALLCWQWREGTIPDTPGRIARMLAHTKTKEIERVLRLGFIDDGSGQSRLVNPKLAEIRVRQLARAGKQSAAARSWRTTEERFLYALAMEPQSYGGPTGPKQIKIGWSRNPMTRLRTLAREFQQTITLIGQRPASIVLERKAHVDLAPYKHGPGEWFLDVPAVRQWLDTNGVTGGIPGAPADATTVRSRSEIQTEIKKSLSFADESKGNGHGKGRGAP